MNWPFVLRSRHNADVAALNADRDRLRRRAETAEGHASTAVSNRKQVLRQNAELDAANTRLAGWNRELHRRLDNATAPDALEAHDAHRKALADALGEQKRHLNWDQLITETARLNKAATEWMADVERLTVQLGASEERARQAVQGLRPEEWESRPVGGAPRIRKDTPSAELQRALDRCAELEELLAAAEGRPAGVKL